LLVAIAVVLAIGLLHPIKAWWVQAWVDAMLRPPGVIHFKQQLLWGLPLGGDWPGYAEFWLDPATNDVRLLRGPRARPERSGML
jgi:hypothetical protein